MSKLSGFRGPLYKWHGKLAETLLKSEPQHLCHICWTLWREFSRKKSLLLICKILGLLFNSLTVDDKYSPLKRGNLLQHFLMQLSQKQKTFFLFFLFFFLVFHNLDSILNSLKIKMTLTADVFLNLRTTKDVLR